MSFIFGFYHVKHTDVEALMNMARSLGITNFDTAEMYGNQQQCSNNLQSGEFLTTKIYNANYPAQITKHVTKLDKHGRFDGVLLHRPMPNDCWKALVQSGSKYKYLGVSNYDINGLNDLINYCTKESLQYPHVNQIEVHPFIDCVPLIEFCKSHNIKVQGHTILTQGKFLNYPPLMELANKYHATSSQILISWALSKGIDLCINSKSRDHLIELLDVIKLQTSDIDNIDKWHLKAPFRFYTKHNRIPDILNLIENKQQYLLDVVDQLKKDEKVDYPSSICDSLPLQGDGYRTTGKEIACLLYSDLNPNAALGKYRALIKSLRHKRIENKRSDVMRKKGLTFCTLKRKEGDYSDSINNPKPMPVDITDPKEFEPLFNFILNTQFIPQSDAIFPKGAIFPDGRLDLCKQVVGPTSINTLCNVVGKTKIIKHFLLGNNVAFQDNSQEGAASMGKLMSNNDIPIETWYLAGNCIDSKCIKIMSQALSNNTHCKALWLKRNPIGPEGAIYLNSLLRINRTLVLLDLHNCALKDEGINNLLAHPQELVSLKHLYLDANGIESTTSISNWCKVSNSVTTLFVSINRLGDKSIKELCSSLKNNKTLKRLCLSSTHMHNDGLRAVVDMALSCHKLKCLDLGFYKSSGDLGEHSGNFFDDEVVPDILTLISSSKSIKYLSITGCKISQEGLSKIPKPDNMSIDVGKSIWHRVHKEKDLRFIKQPKRVVHIDSIYRNK